MHYKCILMVYVLYVSIKRRSDLPVVLEIVQLCGNCGCVMCVCVCVCPTVQFSGKNGSARGWRRRAPKTFS